MNLVPAKLSLASYNSMRALLTNNDSALFLARYEVFEQATRSMIFRPFYTELEKVEHGGKGQGKEEKTKDKPA